MISKRTIEGIFALLVSDPGVTADIKVAVIRALEQGRGDTRKANVRVLKFAEAADRLGVCVGTVRNLVRRGRLKAATGAGGRAMGVFEESLTSI